MRAIPLEMSVASCTTYALLPANRVPRDYTLELLHGLAPQLDLAALRRVLAGLEKPAFAEPGWYAGAADSRDGAALKGAKYARG